jgi:hypothetical protein
MKTKSNRSGWLRVLGIAVLSALVLSSFISVGTAYADEGEQPTPQKYGDQIDERLEALLEKLNEWYAVQDENIGKANNAIARIEELLEKAEQLGLDTSDIQVLMPNLYAAVGRAESAHAQAGEILDEHAGFNGGGKVKDRQEAVQTVRLAHASLESAKDSLLEARDIVQQIIEIAKELRDSYVPPEPSASVVS